MRMSQFAATAREGRDNQVYAPSGARMVAGCVPLNAAHDKVLLVSSTAHPKRWVLPKGGIESDEMPQQSAIRETWEEAGVRGNIMEAVEIVEDMRPPKDWGSMQSEDPVTGVLHHPPRSEFHFFVMEVNEEFKEWPESKKRKRAWFELDQAVVELKKRPELQKVVKLVIEKHNYKNK